MQLNEKAEGIKQVYSHLHVRLRKGYTLIRRRESSKIKKLAREKTSNFTTNLVRREYHGNKSNTLPGWQGNEMFLYMLQIRH
jgi:hypothetical protein